MSGPSTSSPRADANATMSAAQPTATIRRSSSPRTPRGRDPGAALRRSEQRSARKNAVMEMEREFRAKSPGVGINARANNTSTLSNASATSPSSGVKRFNNTSDAFSDAKKHVTPATVGPGSYAQDQMTLSTASNRATPRFMYGTTPRDDTIEVSPAQMAYEQRGLDFVNAIHQSKDGWLLTDYHRFQITAGNREQYLQQKRLKELAKQQLDEDEQQHRVHARAVAKEVADQRRFCGEQRRELERAKAESSAAMKREASERAALLATRSRVYAEYAHMCVSERKNAVNSRARTAQTRARSADAMRTAQREAMQGVKEEREKELLRHKAHYESVRANRQPSPSMVRQSGFTSFSALTVEEKKAVDQANAVALAARTKAKERAKIARKKQEERAAEAAKAKPQLKNLSDIIQEENQARWEAQQERDRMEEERRIAAAEEAARAEAERRAAEAEAAAVEAAEKEAAEAAEKEAAEVAAAEKKKRARAEEKKMKAKAILAGRSQEGTKKGGAGGKAGGGGKPTAAAEGGQAPAPAPEAADMPGAPSAAPAAAAPAAALPAAEPAAEAAALAEAMGIDPGAAAVEIVDD